MPQRRPYPLPASAQPRPARPKIIITAEMLTAFRRWRNASAKGRCKCCIYTGEVCTACVVASAALDRLRDLFGLEPWQLVLRPTRGPGSPCDVAAFNRFMTFEMALKVERRRKREAEAEAAAAAHP